MLADRLGCSRIFWQPHGLWIRTKSEKYMKPFAKSLLAVSITALLFGCGGGGSANDSSTPSTDNPSAGNPSTNPSTNNPSAGNPSTNNPMVQLRVKAIDGVLKGALVWVDLNSDGIQDDKEPSGTSDDKGEVLFTLQAGQDEAPIYVVAIPGQTEDLDRGPIVTAFTMVAPSNGGTVRVVSPLTTLLFLKIAETGDREQAKAALASQLGISSDLLEANFVELGDGKVAFIARSVVDALPPTGLPGDKARQKTLSLALTANAGGAAAIYPKLQDANISGQGVPSLKREIDYNTHQVVFSIEFATREVVDGKTLSKGTKYYWDNLANDYERLNGLPLISTVWTLDEQKFSDGTIERHSTWEKDLDKDGQRNFMGKMLSLGTSLDWTEYYDESSNCVEQPMPCNDNGRIYDGADLKANLAAQDYSAIDFVQVSHKTAVSGGYKINMEEYQAAAPTLNWFNPADPGTSGYSRVEQRAAESEGSRLTFLHYWGEYRAEEHQRESLLTGLDGSTQFSSGKIVWANSLDNQFEEYADYNTFSEHSDTLISYWSDTVTKWSQTGANQQLVTTEGTRYLLDYEKEVKKTDGNPNGYLFSQYRVEQTNISANERHIYVTWDHFAQPDDLNGPFNEADSGQEFKVMRRHEGKGDAMDGWWIGHNYAEWHSRAIADLPGKVLSLLAVRNNFADINPDSLAGLDTYDQAALEGPLFKAGSKSYLISDETWFDVAIKRKLTINGKRITTGIGWEALLQLDGGMTSLILLENACLDWTCSRQNFYQLDTINPVEGKVTFKEAPTTVLYLREADADAEIAP